MKQTNNVILIKICNNSTLLILYFNCTINVHPFNLVYETTTFTNLSKRLVNY